MTWRRKTENTGNVREVTPPRLKSLYTSCRSSVKSLSFEFLISCFSALPFYKRVTNSSIALELLFFRRNKTQPVVVVVEVPYFLEEEIKLLV